MTPRAGIAPDLLPICDWMEDAVCATHTAETVAEAKKLRGMLSTAGFAIVPREPTRKMWAASGTAVVETRERSGNHDHMSKAVWDAMLAAAETADGL